MVGMDIISLSEYVQCDNFFIMKQGELNFIMINRYGTSVASMMKVTVADKVRVAGLMMTKDTLREYLPNLTGKS